MRSDTVLRTEAMAVLLDVFGAIDAERFVAMIKKDTFDYTEWQRDLWSGKSINELHMMATEFERKLDCSKAAIGN
jgi:hypothetical protein